MKEVFRTKAMRCEVRKEDRKKKELLLCCVWSCT